MKSPREYIMEDLSSSEEESEEEEEDNYDVKMAMAIILNDDVQCQG
jgi:hypothetical protein